MPLSAYLTQQEIETVGSCLKAAAYGPFFPDWEFAILFGVEREAVKEVADAWPKSDSDDRRVKGIVKNCMTQLLGYPHGKEHDWERYVSKSPDAVRLLLDKLVDAGY